MDRERKSFEIEFKELKEDGSFTGLASTYGNTDAMGDVVEKGAFTKTIAERAGEVPLLWTHKTDEPVGLGTLEDTDDGIQLTGKLELELPTARKVHTLVKKGIVRGLSIGFETIQAKTIKGIRHLRELKLWEVSFVLFPANPQAQITAVKDFNEELDRRRTLSAIGQSFMALEDAFYDAVWNSDLDGDEKVASIDTDIDQFHTAVMEALPAWLDLLGLKGLVERGRKAGRRISGATQDRIKSAIGELQALLEEEADTDDKSAVTSEPSAADTHSEPDSTDAFHSDSLAKFRTTLVESLRDIAA